MKSVNVKQNQRPAMNKAEVRRSLTAQDKKALPILNKKNTDKNSKYFGMWQEDALTSFIIDRMKLSDSERRQRVQRCTEIDIQMSGVVIHNKEDKKRDRQNKTGKKPQPIAHNLTLTYSQIDEVVTYLMSVFAPEMNIFIASSTAEKQNVAEGLTKEISKQGQILQYYRQIAKMCLNAVKYNFGGVSVNWEDQLGVVFQADGSTAGQLTKTQGQIWAGNVIKSIDAYNFFYDTSIHPCDLPLRGEYFAEVEVITPFRVKRMNQQKILFGVERFIKTFRPMSNTNGVTFYISPPIVRLPETYDGISPGQTNWQMVLNPAAGAQESQPGIELIWYTTWITPSDWDLSDSPALELWRICIANGKFIASAVQIEDSHGQLPCAISTPIEDDLRNDQRTYAEQLMPLQHFASFLLNTHVDATRKAIYGITVFDSSLFPGIDLSTEDLIGARIPMKSSATGIDIDKAFRHYNDAPQTDQNVNMVGQIVELMQKILPTNAAQQVADLERATEYQAAATVQASSRRNLKIARLVNDQCLSVVKFQMLYNIYAKMTEINYVDSQGQFAQITPAQLLEADIEFDVGTGLKGLDRLMQISIFKDIMVYLFQMKDINQQVDVLALLSYVAEIAGFQTDLSRFKIQTPVPAVTAQQPNPAAAGQQTQQQIPADQNPSQVTNGQQ